MESTNLLSRIEDAGLNASAPPQQRLLDGWLLRFSPGKAKRARCVNAIAPGRLPLSEKLSLCEEAYARVGLPLIVRLDGNNAADGLRLLAEAGIAGLKVTQCAQEAVEAAVAAAAANGSPT